MRSVDRNAAHQPPQCAAWTAMLRTNCHMPQRQSAWRRARSRVRACFASRGRASCASIVSRSTSEGLQVVAAARGRANWWAQQGSHMWQTTRRAWSRGLCEFELVDGTR